MPINPFTLRVKYMETCTVITFKFFVRKILWCDHLDETSSPENGQGHLRGLTLMLIDNAAKSLSFE